MKPKSKKTLILSLIKDDLINSKLVDVLENMGFKSDRYLLNLSATVLKLMGFDDKKEDTEHKEHIDDIEACYSVLSKKSARIDISKSNTGLDSLSLEIYSVLLDKRITYQEEQNCM